MSRMKQAFTAGNRGEAVKRPRLEILDGIRCFAAIYVVIFHFAAADRGTWKTPTRLSFGPLFVFGTYGWLGVELFFMISGFVICMSTWGKSIGQFVTSRIIRLYPAYWLSVLLTAVVVLLDRSMATPDVSSALTWPHVLQNLTMTEGFTKVAYVDPSYWTLTIEVTFYALFGLTVAWRGLTYWRVIIFCVAWLTTSLVTIWIHVTILNMVVQPLYAPFFCGGMVMYLIYRFKPDPWLWAVLSASYAISIYRLDDRTYAQHRNGWFMNYAVSSAIVTVFFLVLLSVALGKLDWVRGRWLVTAGALTYPVYLIHQQIGETLLRSLLDYIPRWPLLVLMFAFVLALAWTIHRFVERPVAKALKKVLTPVVPPPARIPSPRGASDQTDSGVLSETDELIATALPHGRPRPDHSRRQR